MKNCLDDLREKLNDADAILIGAGSGLSTSAGFTYSGERFEKYFSDFRGPVLKKSDFFIRREIMDFGSV